MTRIAWFHCFSGVAGDMTFASLLHAGADETEVRQILAQLPIDGWTMDIATTQRNGIAGRHVRVDVHDHHSHRTFADIRTIVQTASLPARVEQRALATFRALAEVEAAIHGTTVDHVHFHEVGGHDAVVDVVGSCAALEVLGIDEIYCSPIAQGLGTVKADHGILPAPAPATLGLLARRSAPTYGLDIPHELTTPTGAALMTTLAVAFGPMPAMTVTAVGYGAGGRTLAERPNLVQVVVGEAVHATVGGVEAVQLSANVDDVTPEVLAHTVTQLLAAGAHDAWVSPIVMKKGRPAHTISALCDPSHAAHVRGVLVAETGTLGVRAVRVERWPQERAETSVRVRGFDIRAKTANGRVKVEHDDAVTAAIALGVPLRVVMDEATHAALQSSCD